VGRENGGKCVEIFRHLSPTLSGPRNGCDTNIAVIQVPSIKSGQPPTFHSFHHPPPNTHNPRIVKQNQKILPPAPPSSGAESSKSDGIDLFKSKNNTQLISYRIGCIANFLHLIQFVYRTDRMSIKWPKRIALVNCSDIRSTTCPKFT